jgi:tetratricopeptide (TPR) repeat protein
MMNRSTTRFALAVAVLAVVAGCAKKKEEALAPVAQAPVTPGPSVAPGTIRGTEPMPASDNIEFLKSLPETSAVAHLNLGDYYLKHGDKTAAIKEYLRAVELKPKYPEALNNLGLAYQRAGDSLAAERSFKDAIAVDSRFTKAYSNLGTLYLRQGRNRDGLTWLQQAVATDSNDAIACSNLGHAYRRNNDVNSALKSYLRALTVDPSRAIDHFHIANIYFDKMLWDDAYERYRMAYELDSTIVQAKEQMSVMESHDVLQRNKPQPQ